jgi:hypothetical protein
MGCCIYSYYIYPFLATLCSIRIATNIRPASYKRNVKSTPNIQVTLPKPKQFLIYNQKLCFKSFEFIIVRMILFFWGCMRDFDSNKNNYLQQKGSEEEDHFNIKTKEWFYQTSVLRTSTSLPPNSALVVTEPSS